MTPSGKGDELLKSITTTVPPAAGVDKDGLVLHGFGQSKDPAGK